MANNPHHDPFDNLRQQAERALNTRRETSMPIPNAMEEIIHELEVHHVELEIQHAELQTAYEKLAESRRRFHDLFEFAPVGYLIIDENDTIQQANLTSVIMLEYDRNKIEGQSFATFVHADWQDTYYLYRRQLIQTRRPLSCDLKFQQQDGSYLHARLDSAPIRDTDQFRIAITDITTLKEAEHTLQVNLERERELSEMRSKLLTMISHELRTPLTIILSSVNTLERYEEKLSTEKKAARYETIRNYVWHLNSMATEMLGAFRNEENHHTLSPERFDIREFCSQMVKDLAIGAHHSRLRSHMICDSDTGEVMQDKRLLHHILLNLLNNALRYSDEVVQCLLRCAPDEITFHIVDQGIGIPQDEQDKIFEIFYRGENTSHIPGTGIGLSIVKQAVDAVGGHIRVESTEGEGTTFIVTVPRRIS